MRLRRWLSGLTGSRKGRDRADAALYCRRGAELHAAGSLEPARESLQKAVELDPDSADARNNLGCVLLAQGKPDAAIGHLVRALEVKPDFLEAAHNLALAWLAAGDLAQAEYFSRLALEIDPASAEMHLHLGNVLRQAGRHEEALASCSEAVRLQPDLAQARNNLGTALRELGRAQEASEAFAKAVALDPRLAEAHLNLGIALHQANEPDRAAAHYRAALELDPRGVDACVNLGMLLEEKGDPVGAIRHYRQAISIEPESAAAHFNLALQLLLTGDFAAGWEEYEWRLRMPGLAPLWPHAGRPRWDGSALDGKTVLLYAEQGFGDAIQFVRFAPLVAERGARVILSCAASLMALFEDVPGIAALADWSEPAPAFDLCCSLLSLPRIFRTMVATLPAKIPYLHANPDAMRRWNARLGADAARLKVGLVWATQSSNKTAASRSLRLGMFSPLAVTSEILFCSLQLGPGADDIAHAPAGMRIVDFGRELEDFSATAALIANLDLVISIDTAVAHLAGAMGKPVWTLTQFPPEWRWLLDRDDSPWYPTMRLFRQERINEWAPVIGRLAAALEERVRK